MIGTPDEHQRQAAGAYPNATSSTTAHHEAPSAPPAAPYQPDDTQQQQHAQPSLSSYSQYPIIQPISSSSPFASPMLVPSAPADGHATIIMPASSQYGPTGSDAYGAGPMPGDFAANYGQSSHYGLYSSYGYGDDSTAPLLGPAYGQHDLLYANRQVRHGFLRKVLGLLTAQLLLTVAIGGSIALHTAARHYMYTNLWVLWLAVVLSFTVLIVLACSEDARRRHPTNLLLLLVFTAAKGVLVGAASASFDTNVVLWAFGITAAATVALTLYALQTSLDFTVTGGVMYSALVILLVVSLANMFLKLPTVDLLISGCGALLFSAYLVFDVQLVASGEHGFQIGADEYVFASLNIYIDVINLFIYLLRIISQLRGNEE